MKRLLKILLAADFFVALAAGMIAPLYAIFVENIGGDILDASGAWATFAIVSGILMYVIGKWEDGHKHYASLLTAGFFLQSLAFLGYFFVANPLHLFLVQALLGVSTAIVYPSYDVLYTFFLEKTKMGSEWGFLEGMDMIIQGISALLGGVIVSFFGFPTLFLLMFILGLIGTAVSGWLLLQSSLHR